MNADLHGVKDVCLEVCCLRSHVMFEENKMLAHINTSYHLVGNSISLSVFISEG